MREFITKIYDRCQKFLKDPLFLSYWEQEWTHYRGRATNQISIRFMSARGRGRYPYYGTSSMFIEDMYHGVMPFMVYRGEREKYPATLEPHSVQKERLIAEGISGRGYNRFLGDALCDFVRNATHTLFERGVALYEIVYERNEAGETTSFSLERVDLYYLFRFFGNYYQLIPWWIAKENHIRVRALKIPGEKILRINMPRRYGGTRGFERMLKRVWKLGEQIVPKFQMDAMEENRSIGFDLKMFTDAKYLEVARLTKCFGWNQRRTSGDNISEYYSMVRYLRQQKVEASIRNMLIGKLNDALNRSPLNLGVTVSMANLPTIEKVEEQEAALAAGDVTFTDVFNALKI
ncbi:MAG: hypothetical protein B7W96_00105 [Parcubacteria group bacterium 37-58-5]|nr:MAG: hypothetical protein B7X03_03750 [Parcubacteria group bacterium 21-58-10]OYV83267.1 MAG: hypothetical protein B7W96_00105 [Parcubacteria group bacterium 37-58-5]